MRKKFSLILVIVFAMSGGFGGAPFATASPAPVTQPEAAAPSSGMMLPKVGGWSKFVPVSANDTAVFKEAVTGFVGVVYEPLAVSKQLVAGMNYIFFCNAKGAYPGAEWYPAMVRIYKPLIGKASIGKISEIETP